MQTGPNSTSRLIWPANVTLKTRIFKTNAKHTECLHLSRSLFKQYQNLNICMLTDLHFCALAGCTCASESCSSQNNRFSGDIPATKCRCGSKYQAAKSTSTSSDRRRSRHCKNDMGKQSTAKATCIR